MLWAAGNVSVVRCHREGGPSFASPSCLDGLWMEGGMVTEFVEECLMCVLVGSFVHERQALY